MTVDLEQTAILHARGADGTEQVHTCETGWAALTLAGWMRATEDGTPYRIVLADTGEVTEAEIGQEYERMKARGDFG